jgi:hypothetical protein
MDVLRNGCASTWEPKPAPQPFPATVTRWQGTEREAPASGSRIIHQGKPDSAPLSPRRPPSVITVYAPALRNQILLPDARVTGLAGARLGSPALAYDWEGEQKRDWTTWAEGEARVSSAWAERRCLLTVLEANLKKCRLRLPAKIYRHVASVCLGWAPLVSWLSYLQQEFLVYF